MERWVLARLHHSRFFSLGALFEAIERAALLSLPPEPFEYEEWKRCRSNLDYHIKVYGHWSSLPSRLIREVVEARASPTA